MSEKSLFFNAFPDSDYQTGYDRNYSGDDLADWFSIVCDTGVLKGGLQATKSTVQGLHVDVQTGKATIQGHGYVNNEVIHLNLSTAPTGSNPRYDLVILRLDNSQVKQGRRIYTFIQTGTTSKPDVNSLTRNSEIYDLLLGYVIVNPNALNIDQSNIVDTRGDKTLCPWFTAVKGYDDYYDAIVQEYEYDTTLDSASSQIVTDISTSLYNDKYSLVAVYTNGLKEELNQYTINTDGAYIVINFPTMKSKDTDIAVILYNFVDGEGLSNVLANYNKWENTVASLSQVFEYTYLCNGSTDNVSISNFVKAWLKANKGDNGLKLNIVGNFGYTYMLGSNPYKLFDFNETTNGNPMITLDFYNCSQISCTVSGVNANMFGYNTSIRLKVKGLNISCGGTNASTSVKVFENYVECEDCRFWINAYYNSVIANGGTFTNCRGSVMNTSGNSYCFLNTTLLRVNGGTYYAYTGGSSLRSAVVGQSASNAVAILNGVSAPTLARANYYQTNSLYQVGTTSYLNCNDLVSALPLYTTSDNIRGTIPLSKTDE